MRARGWLGFGAGAVALVVAMVWMSAEMLELEEAETRALDEARYQENLRLALWRLDQSFSRLLEKEAARPASDYAPFAPVKQQTYVKGNLGKVAQDELLGPSPLLAAPPDYVRLYFQLDVAGKITSPQVPEGVFREIAERDKQVAEGVVDENRRELKRILELCDPGQLDRQLKQAEAQTLRFNQPQQSADKSWLKRAQVAAQAKGGSAAAGPAARGPLEPLWLGTELFLVRRAQIGSERYFQGFLVDWPTLHGNLLGVIEDLFADASLRPVVEETSDRRLFTLPVVLDAHKTLSAAGVSWTATHTVLAITWVVFLLAVAAAGLTLKKSVAFGQQQRRFASLVTHELRSPLTTFRLYSDLLAEGLVKEPDKRDLYHRTLQKESDQMARMVENVIAHSRLEEGRAELQRQRVLVRTLLEEATTGLEVCAAKANLSFSLDVEGLPEVAVATDPAAVSQILHNLVENACKYGRSDERPAILVGASVHGDTLKLKVRDHGPGVPLAVARRIFRPFERGQRDEADPVRGLGLGLALARGLARDLGGDLALETPSDGGACFVLTLPLAGA